MQSAVAAESHRQFADFFEGHELVLDDGDQRHRHLDLRRVHAVPVNGLRQAQERFRRVATCVIVAAGEQVILHREIRSAVGLNDQPENGHSNSVRVR